MEYGNTIVHNGKNYRFVKEAIKGTCYLCDFALEDCEGVECSDDDNIGIFLKEENCEV